jgi:hypothetical protein
MKEPGERERVMSSLGWAVLLVGAALAAQVGWMEYREWKKGRDYRRHTRAVITRLGLPRA